MKQNKLEISKGKQTESNPRGLLYGDVVYITGEKDNCIGKERWPNRPAIIVSRHINKESTVQVIYLSHVLKKGRYNINVTDNMGNTVRACCDQVPCVDYSRVGSYLYHISDAELYSVRKAIGDYLGIIGVDDHVADIKEV